MTSYVTVYPSHIAGVSEMKDDKVALNMHHNLGSRVLKELLW